MYVITPKPKTLTCVVASKPSVVCIGAFGGGTCNFRAIASSSYVLPCRVIFFFLCPFFLFQARISYSQAGFVRTQFYLSAVVPNPLSVLANANRCYSTASSMRYATYLSIQVPTNYAQREVDPVPLLSLASQSASQRAMLAGKYICRVGQ